MFPVTGGSWFQSVPEQIVPETLSQKISPNKEKGWESGSSGKITCLASMRARFKPQWPGKKIVGKINT
jgi:hypothetical protein